MPRKKKSALEMTNDELARSVFPKKVVERLKEIAHEIDEQPDHVGTKKKTDSSRK